MYGALLGDMIGSPYEFDRGNKTKDFPLFSDNSGFTDDSVMTFAVCEALLTWKDGDINELRPILVESMRDWGEHFSDGIIADAYDSGVLINLLRRLKQLVF